MSKIFFFILIFIFCFANCEETKPRNPTKLNKQNFFTKSINRNINIKKKEEIYFRNIIKKDSKSKYFASSKGFWFKITTTIKSNLKPSSGDEVEFSYNILDLEGNDIYKDDDLKPIRYVVDKEEILAALRYGIKELKIGDSGIFLMPSFLCYGYQGDGEKITPNQPLIIQINLISLNTNTN
tara:strand:- start:20120 stop:20662 length:543 start_codon:yes stop_codon:yes gene_type:complete